MTDEVETDRLHALIVAQESKIRELEATLARCHQAGVRLSKFLVYFRDNEPTPGEMHAMARKALD